MSVMIIIDTDVFTSAHQHHLHSESLGFEFESRKNILSSLSLTLTPPPHTKKNLSDLLLRNEEMFQHVTHSCNPLTFANTEAAFRSPGRPPIRCTFTVLGSVPSCGGGGTLSGQTPGNGINIFSIGHPNKRAGWA